MTGALGNFTGLPIHQSNTVPFGHLEVYPDMILIPRTRPTLVFPLLEQWALKLGERPWYWDVRTWPFRQPVEPVEYLRWFGVLA